MLRVAVCDGDVPFAEDLRMQLEACFDARDVSACVQIYKSGAELLSGCPPDLILLGLTLEDADGYQLAEEIRARRLRTELIFVTSCPERMPDAFHYRPIGFIEKPVAMEQLEAVIRRFPEFYWDAGACYCIRSREHFQQIPLRDILYFESSAHKVLIHLQSQSEPLAQTCRLEQIAQELRDQPFIRIHKSFLVHTDTIDRIDRSVPRILLKDGSSLPITRRYYAQVLEQLAQQRQTP